MTREESCAKIGEVINNFQFGGKVIDQSPFGNGHINDTFALIIQQEDGSTKRVILQRMNHEIFKQPVELMENILNVTSYLKKQIIAKGGDPERETLNVIQDKQGLPYYKDSDGNYWRSYIFIEGATCYDIVEKPEDFYNSALAFGNFQRLLADYPANTLHETIKGFHDTKARFARFKQVVAEDKMGRAASVQEEIQFVLNREDVANVLGQMQTAGELPIRVTHNDTKLNNIMIDNKTGKAICVIDLDTVMPGLAVNDFGDSIRFGASTGLEDEPDLNKIWCDMDLFDLYTKGFIEGCNGSLTQTELKMLPMGAKVMTFECGMRFLTDYLEGDVYFRIHRENHNLDRTRTQFKLVADMESKWGQMAEIVAKYAAIPTQK
ncbi:MAG: aminoglycoside phosphotransferase family protein [Lachnospiraceae bacterium]